MGVTDQELLTETIAVRRSVMRHQDISKTKMISELLPKKLRAVEVMRNGGKTKTSNCFPMEALPLLYY